MSQPGEQALRERFREQELELRGLEDALNSERSLLCAKQPDGADLLAAAETKTSCLAQIKQIEAQINALQEALGYPGTREGRQAAAASAGCSDMLRRITDAAARVYRLNGVNGAVVRQRMSVNEKLLEFLRDAQGTVVYGASGLTTPQMSTIHSKA